MKKLLIGLICFYKNKISPKKKAVCRFRPTCSSYAVEAIERHGALLGSIMAFCRIMRCNPLFRGGYDPVPERFSLRSNVGRAVEPSVCDGCEKRNNCDRTHCI